MEESVSLQPNSNGDNSEEECPSKERTRFCFRSGIQQKWALLHQLFIIFLEKLFEISAIFISRRPFLVTLCCLFVTIALTGGFGKLKVEKSVKFLYLPENSEASQDIRRARSLGFELEVRQEELIVLPKPGKSVLSQECLAEMIDLHNIIIEIEHYDEYCFKLNSNSSCASTNILEAFGLKKENLVGNILQRIETIIQNDTFLMSNGRRLLDNFNQIFGNTASINSINSTNALRIVYFMREYDRGEEGREGILEWEKIFLNKVSSFSKNTTCANVFYAAERSLDDSVEESTGSDIKFFAVTFVIMGILSGVVNGRCADARYGHQLLGFSALLSIYLGVTSSLGFLMLVGVPFISMVGVLPFLVVSIGIDDVFIILHELNEMIHQDIPANHILSATMARSGPTITMTTLTDLVAFAVSCRSIFPSIRIFCTYAALTISSVFVLLLTFFVGCMWFDIKRINAGRRDFLPWLMSPSPTDCFSGIRRSGLDNVMKAWGKKIVSPAGKIIIFLSSLILLSFGIYGARSIDESFNRKLFTTEDSHYREFLKVYEENFHLNIEVNIIFTSQADQSSNEIEKKYFYVENLVKNNEYFVTGSISWLSEYISWAQKRNIEINNTRMFHAYLHEFISIPKYQRFAQDLKFSEDKTHLKASRILVYSRSDPDSTFQRNMMASIRKDLFHSSNVHAFAVALPFIYFEQYARVLDETIRYLIVAGISIIVISCLFLNHFVIIFCLMWGFVALIFELLGLMYIWNVSLNSISMINLVMALGFSVDYNAHVAFHFVSSKATTPEFRVIDALHRVGGSVFLRGLSTFLGMMPTLFTSSTIFQTFFKMFVGIVILGLLHGLVILPVYLTLLGKIFDFREENNDWFITKWFNRTKKRKFRKIKNLSFSKSVAKTETPNPIAIVGISCRFPGGANSKDAFWDMIAEGRCGIGTYPTNRPDAREFTDSFNTGKHTPGKHYVLTGAFLDKITGFDAHFFGISPSECRSMDPQQRILLQVVYEAIEDAGIRLEDLQQCRTGVYVGSMNIEYASLVMNQSNIRKIDQFSSTGCALSVLANRISFSLNLTGPSLTMDTACSSSLVALDVAYVHLQNGECDAAIVCAPNILLVGNIFHTACCRTGLLAEDGRCKSFDIKGDGYGRGEGVAAIILKPTQNALDDRDNIYAEVVACGTNNDGQTAIPMTAPSEATQAALFQRVLQESGLSKDDISYVEAHGTGTAVGDVVEMGSLSEVYGNSSGRVLRVGSVKSNINHTESTAGLAGLIKVCLMIKHARFVPTINVHQLKPQLKLPERKMVVQACNEAWKTEEDKPRVAAISSYGFGGTNAHAIVREVTKKPVVIVKNRSSFNRVLTLSAASKDALRAMAGKMSQSLMLKPDDDEILKDDICYSLNERYTILPHRLAVSFHSFKNAAKALEMFSSQTNGWEELVATGNVAKVPKSVVFLYGGQGAQWHGMAKEMLVHEPKFKESIEEIDALLKKHNAPWSLITELKKPEETSLLHENQVGQTALFAIHVALTDLLHSWGVRPSAVVGHSLGEISAAWASGALPLSKALQLVLFRSQLHEKCSPTGCMAAIGMAEEEARRMLQDLQLENEVDVAVVNSPGNVVLSGNKLSVDLVENHVSSQRGEIFWKKLTTTRAYHSRGMDEIKQAYFKLTSKFNVNQTQSNIPFYSTVTGAQLSGHLLSLEHWWRNIRQTVLLEPVLKNMFSDGHQFFLEINAAPQLSYHVRETWSRNQASGPRQSNDVVVVQTLPKRSVNNQHLSFLQNCVARLFVNGVPLSWNKIQGSGSKTFFPRPTYPWQEKEFWYRSAHPPEFVTFLDQRNTDEQTTTTATIHPLLGKTVPTETFTGLEAWESEINLHDVPYIKDHKFSQSSDPVMPAAVYVEMIAAMSLHLSPQSTPEIRIIRFEKLLTISNNDSYRIRTRLLPRKSFSEEKSFQITIVESNEEEIVVSQGSIQLGVEDGNILKRTPRERNFNTIEKLKSEMEERSTTDIEEIRKIAGFAFGPQFNLISQAWSNDTEALSLICPTEEIKNTSAYVIHPSVIDACFQTAFLLKSIAGKLVPKTITGITIFQKIPCTQLFHAHVKIIESKEAPTYSITLMDYYGQVVMIIDKYITAQILSDKVKTTFDEAVFTIGWQQLATESSKASQDNVWLILRDQSKFAERFTQHIPEYESVNFVDVQDTTDSTRDAVSQAIDKVLRKIKGNKSLLVINFWPVDARMFNADANNFHIVHSLTFETCLSVSQEILKREGSLPKIQLVFVTSGVVSIPQIQENQNENFPWGASVFGFRRTFSEEFTIPSASVIDLPTDPSEEDFHAMLQDVEKHVLEEEIVYRGGVRYVNRIKKFVLDDSTLAKKESPLWKDGTRKPIKLASMSGQWFLQKVTNERIKEKKEIEVHYACSILHKEWRDMKRNDCISIAGKIYNGHEETDSFAVGVCKVGDLASFVAAEKCCFAEMKVDFTAQQAASIGFPMAMSYHILTNLLGNLESKRKVLVYHQSEEVCFIFASVALSMDKNVVCLVDNQASKTRMMKFGMFLVVTEDELTRADSKDACYEELDAVCFLGRTSSYVTRQILKHLKSGATVIAVTLNGEETFRFNPWIYMKDVFLVLTSLQDITENSKDFSELLDLCCSVLKSKGHWNNLLNILQHASSIYDIIGFRNESNKRCTEKTPDVETKKEFCLNTISLKPKYPPDQVDFYSLPLDDNGLKDDRTYLVIGGVRGFGFEVARWMVENGAKTVMCTARSAPCEEKKEEVKLLEKKTGARIFLRQADVTSLEEMNVIRSELESLPATAGIVFTAMVLADQLLKNADLKTCREVVGTKVKGSVILHELSLSMDLDFFIMFSSISGVLGNSGQVSYAAANSFLDQLCEYRQNKLGLPALSINWGAISGAGVLERNKDVTSILETSGLLSLHYTKGFEFLKSIMLKKFNEAQVCVCPVDWQIYLKGHTSSRLQLKRDETMVVADDIMLENLALQPLDFRVNYVQDFVKRLLSSWSGSEASELNLNIGLYKYGIDSIVAANMRLRIKNSIGATFETYYFIQPNVSGLTIVNDILEQIENINTTSVKGESSQKANQSRTNSLPVDREKGASADKNVLLSNVFPVYNAENEESEDGVELQSVDNPEKVIPLYTSESVFVKVFMVHGSPKSALALASFAQGFQKQAKIALYGIGVDDTSIEKSDYGTVLTLARRYVDLIRKIQPSGPFYLAGYSFGGLVAYEMASELKRNNETVAMVFMVDTYGWHPKALANSNEFVRKFAEHKLKLTEKYVTRKLIEKMAFAELGINKDTLNNFYGELQDDVEVIAALESQAAEENLVFPLKEKAEKLQYELRSAAEAHLDWQPSKICYEGTLTYVSCDETNSFSLSTPAIWGTLVERMDLLYVSGRHLELSEETRAEICGFIMMTTAAMNYLSKFSYNKFQAVRSKRQERLVEFLKQGLSIWMLSSQSGTSIGSLEWIKGTLLLNCEETVFSFRYKSFGFHKMQNIAMRDLTNIIPGRHVDVIQKHHGKKSYVDLLTCMLTKKDRLQTFRSMDMQRLKLLVDCLKALFGIPFMH